MKFDVSSTIYEDAIIDVVLFIEKQLCSDGDPRVLEIKERRTGHGISHFELYDWYCNVMGNFTIYLDSDGNMILSGDYKDSTVYAYYSCCIPVADKIVLSTFDYIYVRIYTDNGTITKRFETYE